MFFSRLIMFASLLSLTVPPAICATFSANGGVGSSTIGSGGDYSTLFDAATDFNGPTPVTGNYTFFVTSDLVETTNSAFGKATNGNTIILKPAAATSATITFTNLAKNIGYDAHLCFGTTSTQIAGDQLTTTSNFIIDGSNSGGSTRNLRLVNVTSPTWTTPSVMLRVVGGCSNIQFRNLFVDNVSSGTGANRPHEMDFTSRRTTTAPLGAGDYIPTNCTVDNCALTSPHGADGYNIITRASGTLSVGKAQTGMAFTNNEMQAVFKCLELGQTADATISGNTFSSGNGLSARPQVIQHNGCNSTTGWTMNISNNKFLSSRGATAAGGSGFNNCIEMGGGLTTATVGTAPVYNITNNTFGGYNLNGVTVSGGTGPPAGLYHCIVVATATSPAIVNILHNSINMPNFPNLTAPNVLDRFGAIALSGANYAGSMTVKNNIIRMEQNNGVVFYRANNGVGTLQSDYNMYWIGSTGSMASYKGTTAGTTTSKTLADWKAAGFDSQSKELNPTVINAPAPGKWVLGPGDNDLHFDAKPHDSFAGTPLPAVPLDIDGDTRSATAPYMGADERAEVLPPAPINTAAQDWSMFM